MKGVIVITGASSGFGALAQTLEPDSARARSPALSRRHRSVSKPRSEYASRGPRRWPPRHMCRSRQNEGRNRSENCPYVG